jgi:hypothetical protein
LSQSWISVDHQRSRALISIVLSDECRIDEGRLLKGVRTLQKETSVMLVEQRERTRTNADRDPKFPDIEMADSVLRLNSSWIIIAEAGIQLPDTKIRRKEGKEKFAKEVRVSGGIVSRWICSDFTNPRSRGEVDNTSQRRRQRRRAKAKNVESP